MEAFPSEAFWEDLGISPGQAVGRTLGPRHVAGISGWSYDDVKIATALTKEIPELPRAKGTLLLGLIATRAPKAGIFLSLVRRYSQTVKRYAIKAVAIENGFLEPLPRSRRLVLLLFKKNPELLKRVQYRSLAVGGSVSYPFLAAEDIDRRRLTARGFREKLGEALQEALDPEGVRRAEVDYVDAKRGGEAVVFSVRFELKPKRMEQWVGAHTDVPVKRGVLRALPKYRMLEVVSRQGKNTPQLAAALSSALWGEGDKFHALSEEELASEAGRLQIPSSGVKVSSVVLRTIEAENVGLDGSPSVVLDAADLAPTLKQFREIDVDFTGKVASWRMWIRYTSGDLTSETVVRRTRASNRVQFSPEPPLEVKVEVYRRLKDGLTELELH